MGISGFLREVVALKRVDVARAEGLIPLKQIRQEVESALKNREPGYRNNFAFLHAIENSRPGNVGIIAEIKKASPSRGDIRPDLDPAKYAQEYTEAGACAVSVLTEEHYFKGSLADLKAVRAATSLPLLRKDFTLSSYQIYEAKAAGADSILLITSMLSKEQLRDYVALSREIGMEPLVEIHSEWELDKALFASARVVGINNRNLETLETDLNVAKRVVPFFSSDQIAVEASGISSSEDIRDGLDSGIFTFLVGESIVRAENKKEFIQTLVSTGGDSQKSRTPDKTEEDCKKRSVSSIEYSEERENRLIDNPDRRVISNRFFNKKKRPAVKICGLTTIKDALACVKAGADAIGFIFYPKSPRFLSLEQAAEISMKLPDDIMTTGVFVDQEYKEIVKAVRECSLKAVQLHGNESPSLVQQLAKEGIIVIKVLFAGREPHLTLAHLYIGADALLVEYGRGDLPGGNGESWNWELAAGKEKESSEGAKESSDSCKVVKQKVILAGGLTPENIKKAIEMADPWGIDLSSGVEFSPGQKDIARVEQLIGQLR